MATTEKIAYMGTLVAIATAEHRTALMMRAWRDTTEDKALAAALDKVANTEEEHGIAFTKHARALGADLNEDPMAEYVGAVTQAVARSKETSDLEKFRQLMSYEAGVESPRPDPLIHMMDEPTIDSATGALIGRYIAEERESERCLKTELNRIARAAEQDNPQVDEEDELIAQLATTIRQLSGILKELKRRGER